MSTIQRWRFREAGGWRRGGHLPCSDLSSSSRLDGVVVYDRREVSILIFEAGWIQWRRAASSSSSIWINRSDLSITARHPVQQALLTKFKNVKCYDTRMILFTIAVGCSTYVQ